MHDKLALLEKEAKSPLGPQSHNGDPPSETPRLADLLDELDVLIRRFVQLPKAALSILLAVWLVGTYTFHKFRYCGYLALRSATPRCGKTLLMRILSQSANGTPSITSLPTPAVLFRSTRPVLLLDEVDKLRNVDKEKYGEVLAVLNCGFEKGAVIERCNRKTFDVESYNVYGPKALAGIEGIADTLADRSFQIQMERSAHRMPRLNLRKMDDLFVQLRAGLQGWADDHGDQIDEVYDGLPDQLDCLDGFDDRFQDIAEPLIVLATLADAERPDGPAILPRLLEGLKAAAGRREPSGRERQILAFLDIAARKLGEADEVFVRSADLLADCATIEDLAFIETGRKLAGLLKHFDLCPSFNPAKTERGYWIKQFWITTWRGRYPKTGDA
ncbi:MAG: DUF3631 domain-containing protein [Pyrinomonadaceae bacterium]|nr:DUF3631 domain-containing protein [Pyrinomonadaceae bacterium]